MEKNQTRPLFKRGKPQPKAAKVIIEVKGGLVQQVRSNVPVEFVVIDYDELEAGGRAVGWNAKADLENRADLHMIYQDEPDVMEDLKKLQF